MAHTKNIEAAYRQYVSTYTNCTYIDGNVEVVFLTNRTNYDLSFLKVRLIPWSSLIVVEKPTSAGFTLKL